MVSEGIRVESKESEVIARAGSMYELDFSKQIRPQYERFNLKSGDKCLMTIVVSRN